MPLKKGKSSSVVSGNIAEMMHKFRKDGCVGKVCTSNKKKQQQVASAIAYQKAGLSRK